MTAEQAEARFRVLSAMVETLAPAVRMELMSGPPKALDGYSALHRAAVGAKGDFRDLMRAWRRTSGHRHEGTRAWVHQFCSHRAGRCSPRTPPVDRVLRWRA